MKQMETNRLVLREFREQDFDAIYSAIYADEAVWGMYSGLGAYPDEIRRRFVQRCHQPGDAEFGFRALELKTDGCVIGQIHLEPHVLDPRSIPEQTAKPFHTIEVELAFALGKPQLGSGSGT